jgi:hypothetical protein
MAQFPTSSGAPQHRAKPAFDQSAVPARTGCRGGAASAGWPTHAATGNPARCGCRSSVAAANGSGPWPGAAGPSVVSACSPEPSAAVRPASATPGLKWSYRRSSSPSPSLHLLAHTVAARGPAFQIGHATMSSKGHPQRQVTRGFAGDGPAVAPCGSVLRSQPRECAACAPRTACRRPGPGSPACAQGPGPAWHRVWQPETVCHVAAATRRWCRRPVSPAGSGMRRAALPTIMAHEVGTLAGRRDDVEGAGKPAQTRLGATALRTRITASQTARENGSTPAGGHGAKHHGADHGAGLAGDRSHVEHWCSRLWRARPRAAAASGMRPSPSCMRSLVVSVRVDELMTWVRCRRGIAVADLAHGFQQFRRHQQVERTGHRIQAENRAGARRAVPVGTGNSST